jgi:endonuclease/exonuclease/phosphatase family metal-dependent hydrolase
MCYFMSFRPAEPQTVKLACNERLHSLRPGESFKLLSWNIQFSATRRQQFFYDGGKAVHVPREDVLRGVKRIAAAIRDLEPDILLLQEVDRDSDRTHRIDQLLPYIRAGRFNCAVSTPYHRARYVPYPPHEHLGRVDLHLATLSRYRMQDGRRTQLAMLDETWVRRMFNMKRALLTVTLPIEGGEHPLMLGNTHLSAFSYGDGTQAKQVATLVDFLQRSPLVVLGGDLNVLPPGDDGARLSDAQLYRGSQGLLARMLGAASSAVPRARLLEPRWRTYVPFGSDVPDRKIDYVFANDLVEIEHVAIPRVYAELSDHLPIQVRLRVRDKEAPFMPR